MHTYNHAQSYIQYRALVIHTIYALSKGQGRYIKIILVEEHIHFNPPYIHTPFTVHTYVNVHPYTHPFPKYLFVVFVGSGPEEALHLS